MGCEKGIEYEYIGSEYQCSPRAFARRVERIGDDDDDVTVEFVSRLSTGKSFYTRREILVSL